MKQKVISFPHMGNYYPAFEYLFNRVSDCQVLTAPPITKRTLELGSKYSPDFVCVPFKYNLGNFIEAADIGANMFVQSGGSCRFGYYGESQQEILRNLGYEFEFYNLPDEGGKITLSSLYSNLKTINGGKLNKVKFIYHGLITIMIIGYIDRLEDYIRKSIGFGDVKYFEKVQADMLKNFAETKGIFNLIGNYFKYKKLLRAIPLHKPEGCLKVGIIGELFLCMEPASNYNIEMELAKMGVEIHRTTNLSYILISKPRNRKQLLKETKGYLEKVLSGDGIDNIAHAKHMCEHHIDGIIHVKPFGCIPEVGAIPIIDKITHDHEVPAIYLSFDSQTSEEGIRTRLEAFYDMIEMKKAAKCL